MTTNTRTETAMTHAAGAVAAQAAAAPSPADERLLHPGRPARRRPVRDPHARPETDGPGTFADARTSVGGRTTPAGRPPSSAHRTHGSSRVAQGVLVPPTALPDHSGDLLGTPDFSALLGGLRRMWAWLAGEVRAAAELDARLRARREEDSATMLRAGVDPTRLG